MVKKICVTRTAIQATQNNELFKPRIARMDTNFDYVFDFVLLWEPKGSVVATDANVPRRRCALAGHPDGDIRATVMYESA